MSLHTYGYFFEVENFGGWNNGVSKFYFSRTINNEHVYAFSFNGAALANLTTLTYETIIYKSATSEWCDYDSASNPWNLTTVSGVTIGTDANGNNMMKWGHAGYPDPTISSGPTVTQSRTTHTGLVLNSTSDFTIKNPSPGAFYEKTGPSKFKIKFLDLNEPATYLLQVTWTTLTGTISDIQTISSNNGDIEIEYEGTSPNNTPVYGPVTVQIDNYTVTNGNIQYSPGNVFKTFTYYETGPFTASFSPDFGLPGQAINVHIKDHNPFSDTDTWFEQTPGGSLISAPLNSANTYEQNITNAFASQHGTYKIYNGVVVLATANYDSNYVDPTKNGGGKPDRYPLIMTNLFNRNKSLYSIGMTHKDRDLFFHGE